MRKLMPARLILILIFMASIPRFPFHAISDSAPYFSSATELIDAVNALRSSYGLSPYTPNNILMSLAQGQAEYILSIGTGTHISANGLRPFERALQAGYPVAGDLSLGGFFSENITEGSGMTAAEAVENWTGDAPHLNTMISPNLQDIGAGVAFSGTFYYYVIDCGLSTSGTAVPYSAPPISKTPFSTVVPKTPNADGSITYIVKPGDTALGIAIANGLTLDELLGLNGLTAKSIIYPNQVIIVHAGFTPTATQPTSTPTDRPTITPWPTSTPTLTRTPIPPTPTPSPGLSAGKAQRVVTTIIVASMIVAALAALISRRRK
jgi:uncharacterized protein YkwD